MNLGRVGFLAEAEREDLQKVVERVVDQDYEVEERMTIDVVVRTDGRVVHRDWALNEASIEKVREQGQAFLAHRRQSIVASEPDSREHAIPGADRVKHPFSRLKPAAPSVDLSVVWRDTVKRGPMVRQVRGLGTLEVHAHSQSPAVGAKAYPSRTPTIASTGGDFARLTTRVPPDRGLLRHSIPEWCTCQAQPRSLSAWVASARRPRGCVHHSAYR